MTSNDNLARVTTPDIMKTLSDILGIFGIKLPKPQEEVKSEEDVWARRLLIGDDTEIIYDFTAKAIFPKDSLWTITKEFVKLEVLETKKGSVVIDLEKNEPNEERIHIFASKDDINTKDKWNSDEDLHFFSCIFPQLNSIGIATDNLTTEI